MSVHIFVGIKVNSEESNPALYSRWTGCYNSRLGEVPPYQTALRGMKARENSLWCVTCLLKEATVHPV